jgi:hypothetical protein
MPKGFAIIGVAKPAILEQKDDTFDLCEFVVVTQQLTQAGQKRVYFLERKKIRTTKPPSDPRLP